jgi:uncharacterized protein with NRDE domain
MCTVLLRFAPGTARPLLLGAVRDEFVDRAWDPPAAHWGDRLLGGRDRTAGGTWLAVDPDRPAVAAVLNGVRRPPDDGARPTRGQLPFVALRGQPLPVPDRYDGYHLVLATPDEVRVWSWDGSDLSRTRLDPGDHVIVNQGVDMAKPEVAAALAGAADRGAWVRLLASDTVLVDVTVGGRRYGSTSTSLVEFADGGVRYAFNPRPRDPAGWYPVRGGPWPTE